MKQLQTSVRTQTAFNLVSIFETIGMLKDLQEQLNELYPEREFLIMQLGLTLMVRANHLTFGIYGSGKSELLNELLKNLGVQNEEIFRIDMSRQTTESEVIGPVDLPKLQQGIQVRNPLGTIRDAKYADLGEFFDAPMLLRMMLSMLHEREYRRGADSHNIPLQAAFASTNVSPGELLKMYPDLDALVDRFLFQCTVNWLEDDDSLRRMLNKFRKGLHASAELVNGGMDEVVSLVTSATDQLSDSILEVYIQILKKVREVWRTHKEEGWNQFSDRTFALWTMVIEALAIYNGHYHVELPDLYGLKYVACNGSKEQLAAFEQHINPIIKKALDSAPALGIDDVAMMALQQLQSQFDALPEKPQGGEMVVQMQLVTQMQITVSGMSAQLPENQAKIKDLKQRIQRRIESLEQAFRGRPS